MGLLNLVKQEIKKESKHKRHTINLMLDPTKNG